MDQAERLKYFNLETPPPFAKTILKEWPEEKFREFEPYIIEEQRHGSASVNVFRVVGTRHPDYAGKTWLDLLMNGRRMMVNLPLFQDNPGYYLETGTKEPYMHYQSIDGGDVYIGAEGNHRTCIARFFFFTQGMTTLHGITLDDYRIDWAFKEVCDELMFEVKKLRLPFHLTVTRKLIDRQDAADWRLDRFALTARVFDARRQETFELDREGLCRFIDEVKKPWWKKISFTRKSAPVRIA
ncbi:hypothetical protein GF1_16480 [Desulfolithobacter dissulfuricans]|uniref:Uncharacterized protein n=1 Tax=Desulfolithobacter dissulfuricans TaxID=2795293 RepID=A0A915U2F7_9BACT|nr:hypothetical protein [Desulfolithobacter dissulfuricans]BCO09272.1 hypothetical protein GF1_16480 [Desulfolithobacter dissulfuricans]